MDVSLCFLLYQCGILCNFLCVQQALAHEKAQDHHMTELQPKLLVATYLGRYGFHFAFFLSK